MVGKYVDDRERKVDGHLNEILRSRINVDDNKGKGSSSLIDGRPLIRCSQNVKIRWSKISENFKNLSIDQNAPFCSKKLNLRNRLDTYSFLLTVF